MKINISSRCTVFLILLFFSAPLTTFSQSVPVGSYSEDILRRNQIAGNDSSLSSFVIRPLSTVTENSPEGPLTASVRYLKFNLMGISSGLRIMPFNWLNEYNVKRPYGYNNGSLYPNAGYQSMASGGFFLKAGIFNVQIKPEFVYAQNKSFSTFTDVHANNSSQSLLLAYADLINGIDAPERFGTSSLKRVYPGQSKITLSYQSIEAGISTENLWWGPGIRNSIMMSNSAPGFFHWTFNSIKPVKTIAGSFEWQIIGGNLKQSGFAPDDLSKLKYGNGLFTPKPKVSRYLSAFNVNWQPKWLKGLYLGVSAYDYLDKDSVYRNKNIFRKVIPVIIGSSVKANDSNNGQNGDQQDFAYSFNIRQLLPLYKAELYFEYGRNDRTGSLSDFLQEPDHSAAYTFGGRKLFELGPGRYLQIKSEITQLQRSPTYLLRDEPSWYVHLQTPRDGYTNYGRYIGAGIGPGSNSFVLDFSYIKDYNSYGLMLERQLHNNDLYYQAFTAPRIFNQHWVDIAGTFYANVKIKNYLVSAEATPVYTLNYEYRNGSSFNLHARINFTYFFR